MSQANFSRVNFKTVQHSHYVMVTAKGLKFIAKGKQIKMNYVDDVVC